MQIPTIWLSALVFASELVLLCVGFTLTHITTKVPNFAHGTFAGIGIYVSYTFSQVLEMSPYYGFPFAFLIGGIISTILYIFVIGTITRLKRGIIVLTISTLALQILLTSGLNIYAFWLRAVFKTYAQDFLLKNADFRYLGFPGIFLVSSIISLTSVIVLHFFLTKTRLGVAMKATAINSDLASVLGIDTNFIQTLTWFLTGGLASLAGAMIPMWFMSSPTTGVQIMTSIMAGSVLGGLQSIYGAIIGGFLIGVFEIILTTWLAQIFGMWVGEYRSMIPIIFLVIVIMFEPAGLYGVYLKIRDKNLLSRLEDFVKIFRKDNND
jgi:branched-chain amino acid transport system permease protein